MREIAIHFIINPTLDLHFDIHDLNVELIDLMESFPLLELYVLNGELVLVTQLFTQKPFILEDYGTICAAIISTARMVTSKLHSSQLQGIIIQTNDKYIFSIPLLKDFALMIIGENQYVSVLFTDEFKTALNKILAFF